MTEKQIIFNILFIFVAAGLAALLTYRFGIKTSDRNRRLDAGAKLYNVFVPELIKLTKNIEGKPYAFEIINRDTIRRHISAASEFRYFLNPDEIVGFDRVCSDYENDDLHYNNCGRKKAEPLCKKCASERIHNILQYTEPGIVRKNKAPSCEDALRLVSDDININKKEDNI